MDQAKQAEVVDRIPRGAITLELRDGVYQQPLGSSKTGAAYIYIYEQPSKGGPPATKSFFSGFREIFSILLKLITGEYK